MRWVTLICLLFGGLARGGEPAVNVSVAISLKEAVTEAADAYKQQTGREVRLTFGASGTLMAQIKNGAPVDAFISAAPKQVDELIAAKLADPATRRVVATNDLVLIAPPSGGPSGFDELLKVKRIAIGDPKSVPAGDYAVQALQAMKLYEGVKDRLVFAENVRQVLDYVIRGEVDAGIVYRTDAKQAGEKVKVVATADAKTHQPIEYPAVVMSDTKRAAEAKGFLEFLEGEKGKAILKGRGFGVGDEKK